MRLIFLFLLNFFLLMACHTKMPPQPSIETTFMDTENKGVVAEPEIPYCIQRKIDSLQKLPVMNPAAQVDEYIYNGEKVYGFSLGCCDMFYEVLNTQCEYVCAPAGGFTGKGDGKCTDFNQHAKLTKVVWKDVRKGK